jgi:AcrR family transcriptional regulator
MASIRMDGEERRRGIVEAALPLFARRGFAGTTTREIAEAARVSEALVFKHFPSKAALYTEILNLGCEADPALERFARLEASTSTLILMMHFMVHRLVTAGLGDPASRAASTHRLLLASCVEDGEVARLVFEALYAVVFPKFQACLAAAQRAGDLVDLPVAPENRFWLAHHVAAMAGYVRLCGTPIVPYNGDVHAVMVQAVHFILRGIGLKDAVIAALYDPAALTLRLQSA